MPDLASAPIDERVVTLDGSLNTRDLGGLPLAHGGRTRFGVMLRSDAVLGLALLDAERLEQLGLTTVIDLRGASERERAVSAFVGRDGVDVHHVEIWQAIHDAGATPSDAWDLTSHYLAALDHAAGAFAQATRLLVSAPGAALFHCTAGKGRTGLLAALLLEAVGVPRSVVIDDYVLTHDRIDPLRERLLVDAESRGIAREDFARLLGATPDLLQPALEHLDARYGGARAYLRSAGVEVGTLRRLEERLAGAGATGTTG